MIVNAAVRRWLDEEIEREGAIAYRERAEAQYQIDHWIDKLVRAGDGRARLIDARWAIYRSEMQD